MNEDLRTDKDTAEIPSADHSSAGTDTPPPQSFLAWVDQLTMEDLKAAWYRLGPVGPLAAAAMVLTLVGELALVGTVAWTAPWLKAHGHLGIGLFVLGSATLAGVAVLPTHPQSALAGWAFGLKAGSVASLLGIAGASVIGYLIARRASGDRIVRLISEQPKWKAVYDALIGSSPTRALLIVTLVRVASSPFAITNLVMAACKIRPWIYLLGTVVGIAPRTIVMVFLGARLAATDFHVPKDRWLFIAVLVTGLIVVAIIGAIANQAVKRVTGQGGRAEVDGKPSTPLG
jgi:uncharacterized membrane protein YdjX (TVP38/TMEM64 family)